jgi:hypothetical protein
VVPPLAELRPDIPKKLVDAVHKALAQEPGARFPSARYMANELGDALRELGWGDADTIVSNAVAEARAAQGA